MVKDPWDKYYNKLKERKINSIYSDVLCEFLLLRYELVYKDIYKRDILKELPGIRELKPRVVENIYNKAVKLLELKYNVRIVQEDPFVFEDLEK